MPTNQQRREAAQRKLERQLVRRQEQERARRQRLIVVGVVATVVVVAGVIWFATTRGGDKSTASTADGTSPATASSSAAPKTPCTYTAGGKAAKEVKAPTNLSPANTGTVAATLTLNGQKVDVTLDRAAAPCTVNSFVSLASQGFYNNSPCWRLTANAPLSILQCGDPTGVGNGGPGYTFADELTKTKTYPKGTIAMANGGSAAPDSNGSQFFIVYKDSKLDPTYTVFGKVSDAGMAVIEGIAAKGVKNNAQDGPPVAKAVIDSVDVPKDAVSAVGTYVTASSGAAATGAAGSGAPTSSGAASGAAGSGAAGTGAAPTSAASSPAVSSK